MCVQHGLKFMYKPVGSCHMYCICCSITFHFKLYMFSLFILIIVNVIVFILFYLQVEPVYLRVSDKPIQITSCVINIGNNIYIYIYRWSRIKTGYLHFSNCSGESKNFRISLFFILLFLFHNIM